MSWPILSIHNQFIVPEFLETVTLLGAKLCSYYQGSFLELLIPLCFLARLLVVKETKQLSKEHSCVIKHS